MFRTAREGLEAGGASGLYLALGFLEWFESPSSDRRRRAPLILVPVDLQRGSVRDGLKVTRAADETRFNSTLLQMLGAQHSILIPGVDPLPKDDTGVDVNTALQRVTAAIRDIPRWRVAHEAYLGFFTFAKYLMWKDLDEQASVLLQNRMVSHLVHQPERSFDSEWREPELGALDDQHRTGDLFCPVLADSSQLASVVAAANGKSFVLEGPPGTGKSQTITNLIAHCLALGKTVLFVSEKTAALNVVFDRLKGIGLERFCLELHSNKANKLQVVQSLGRSLRGAREHTPSEWNAAAEELDRVRAELNEYSRAISREHANGLSVFRATSQLTTLRAAPRVDLHWTGIEAVQKATLEEARTALREAQNALVGTGDPCAHALAGVGTEELPLGLGERIRESLGALRTKLAALPEHVRLVSEALGIDLARASEHDLHHVAAACQVLGEAPDRGFALIAVEAREAGALVEEGCRLGRARDALRVELEHRFDLRILRLDLLRLQARAREATASWPITRWFKTRALRKALFGVAKEGVQLSLPVIRDTIALALRLKETDASLATALTRLGARARADWRADTSPWPQLEAALAWATRARAAIAGHSGSASGDPGARALALFDRSGGLGPARTLLTNTHSAVTGVLASSAQVAVLLRLSTEDPWHATAAPGRIALWRERIQQVETALPQLKAWALWRRLRSRLISSRLAAVVTALERGSIRRDQLLVTFERSFLEAWLELARAQEPTLRDFLSLSHEQRISRFRQLDEQVLGLARKVIAAKLSARVPSDNSESVAGSELGVLRRQLQLQRGHQEPRQLFKQTKTLAQRLKPCFLMSPISVAQYLPPGAMSFDVVVFDEASQIPTWDAVGAIARGRQAIVVGDSKQLPPTDFFEAAVSDDENDNGAVEDLESILEECRASGVPALDLRWHYRSQHESLITFSNRKYYENRLHTFPSACGTGLGVQWRPVPRGVYDRGRSGTNRVEAEAVVAEVLRRLRDPELARLSIGVVTFSRKQQEMVEDLLDEEQRKDPALESYFLASEGREAVFIKNLENVQGDERDVILFSICYGPDETGRVLMNFGPLNRQGGARRLNVAVTRARRELLVFSTLTADHIDLARSRHGGVADLKAFLAYAQHGMRALPAVVEIPEADNFESPLESEVCEALRRRGHTVISQVGCSGYRIDLGVIDPDRPGTFLLGIECDGRNYHSAKTARDRDRLRQAVLERLGWRLVRVWSSDWWEVPEEQLNRLCDAIEEACQKARASDKSPSALQLHPVERQTSMPTPFSTECTPAEPGSAQERQRLASYQPHRAGPLGTRQQFYEATFSTRTRAALLEVVQAEGPVSLELAASRVAERFGFERIRQKAVDRIDELARKAGLFRTAQAKRTILWPVGVDPSGWRGFRVSQPSDPGFREAVDLPLQEIANAAAHVLLSNGVCPRRDLQRALARLFGFRALGGQVAAQIDAGIDHLVASARARIDGDARVELAA